MIKFFRMRIKAISITHNRCRLSTFLRQFQSRQKHLSQQTTKINRPNPLKSAIQEDTVKLGLHDQDQPKKNLIQDHHLQTGKKKTRVLA